LLSTVFLCLKGGDNLKRLKNILLSLRNEDITYKKMYDGKIHMLPEPQSNEPPINLSEPIYWNDGIYYKIERTNRLEAGKPTITIGIPIKKLKIVEGLINGTTRISQKGIPAADYCLRNFKKYLDELNETITNRKRTPRENGRYYIYEPGGKVLKRNCSYFKQSNSKYYANTGGQSGRMLSIVKNEWYLNLMIIVQLPEKKLKQTIQMLTKDLPNAVEHFINDFNVNEMKQAVILYNRQEDIRQWLRQSNYCVFIGEGSILPREKDSDLPMKNAKPFVSIPADRIRIGSMTGMGIKKGVTVITGGGYSGKSTLLDAISEGIYNHIGGDGREYVVTDSTAIKISAEDGRSIRNLNISPFITWIPGTNTTSFTTDHASGSTSQAANIIEAVNDGSGLLLIDEDKSATNFMIRDETMKELVKNDPIIPFTDRVQELYETQDVSTILVIGGSSEYLKVSDQIIMMKNFIPFDVTKEAKKLISNKVYTNSEIPLADWNCPKIINTTKFTPYQADSTSEYLDVSDKGFLEIGNESIDVRNIHNIASYSQLTAIGLLIRKIENEAKEKKLDIRKVVEDYIEVLETGNLDEIYTTYFTTCGRWLELPRKFEVLAILYRMRNI
jgi:predicted ABC-class ATPase